MVKSGKPFVLPMTMAFSSVQPSERTRVSRAVPDCGVKQICTFCESPTLIVELAGSVSANPLFPRARASDCQEYGIFPVFVIVKSLHIGTPCAPEPKFRIDGET